MSSKQVRGLALAIIVFSVVGIVLNRNGALTEKVIVATGGSTMTPIPSDTPSTPSGIPTATATVDRAYNSLKRFVLPTGPIPTFWPIETDQDTDFEVPTATPTP